MNPLLSELMTANRCGRDPELVDACRACGLPIAGVPVWGFGFVEPIGNHYAPRIDGRPAIILPCFADGVLIDLTATSIESRRTLTRDGAAAVLGRDAIDRAMETETHLQLFGDPIEWLRNYCLGAVVLDWRAVQFWLADLPGIACTSEMLAKRVDKALRQPGRVPPLFVKEGAHREAA